MTDQMPPGWENQVPPGPYGQPGYPPFGQPQSRRSPVPASKPRLAVSRPVSLPPYGQPG